eukprot:CAMPEP_0116899566 /NCGR_PEP_ID=MMETSP0467-20121206/8094_1 /TAXON_ID=283647 /ORGANISM="Mesodinium pulex, Strain SPMC105" /LENGTH=46 /DNA_ID= /DNA_START= /DNA_END= /DNA_ORIENTATION=
MDIADIQYNEFFTRFAQQGRDKDTHPQDKNLNPIDQGADSMNAECD